MFTDDRQQVRQVKKEKRWEETDRGLTKTDKEKKKLPDSHPCRKIMTTN